MKKDEWWCRGSVGIIVLLLCTLLIGIIQMLYILLRDEVNAANEVVLRRQLQVAASDALNCALKLEQNSKLSESFFLPETTLLPINQAMQTEIIFEEDEKLPGRKLSSIAMVKNKKLQLTEVCLQPPLGKQMDFYKSTLTAGGMIEGTVNEKNVLCISNAGNILDSLSVTQYQKWSHYSFLTNDEYQKLGFGKGVYYSKDALGAKLPCLVRDLKGDAFLISEKNVTIEKNLHLPGRITLVVGDNLILEDNVCLDKVLLVVKHNLRIGNNCKLKGIVVAGGDVTLGANFSLERDSSVLEPYFSATYLE